MAPPPGRNDRLIAMTRKKDMLDLVWLVLPPPFAASALFISTDCVLQLHWLSIG